MSYRQGQGPFSGQVQPPGTALLVQEEFTSGVGNSFAPGLQQLPPRWLDWKPAAVDPGETSRVVDVLPQRFLLFGSPPPVDPSYQWSGSVLRLPPLPYVPDDPNVPDGDATVLLAVFAGVGLGPALLESQFSNPPGNAVRNQQALVVSAFDLSLFPDAPFLSLGSVQETDGSGSESWTTRAQLSDWLDSSTLLSTQGMPTNETGILVRADLIVARVVTGPGPTYDFETELIGSFSTDLGASWVAINDGELKGAPSTIGFGAAGFRDSGNDFNPSRPVGVFDFLRVYVQPLSEVSLVLDPDGGRNWPGI